MTLRKAYQIADSISYFQPTYSTVQKENKTKCVQVENIIQREK